MAVPYLAQWEVRPDGDDLNGGAFNPTRSGATKTWDDNYTYGPSYMVVIYDGQQGNQPVLTPNGTNLNQVQCSGGRAFVQADVGHIIRIISGTNVTPGRYEITSVSGGIATLDSNCWTSTSGSSAVARMGGAVTLAHAVSQASSDSVIWVKSSTYNISASLSQSLQCIHIIGYNTTRGDNPAGDDRPLIQPTVDSITLISLTGARSLCANLRLSSNSRSNITGILLNEGFAINCTATGLSVGFYNIYFCQRCSAVSCTLYGFQQCTTYSCVVIGNGVTQNGLYDCSAFNSIVTGTTSHGCNTMPFSCIVNCVFHAIGGSGVNWRAGWPTVSIVNCIFSQVSGYACNYSGSPLYVRATNNGLYNVTSGFSQAPKYFVYNTITLTAPPFVDAANGDFRLNNLPGGGALCRAAGIGPAGQISALDIGAVQTASDAQLFIIEDD